MRLHRTLFRGFRATYSTYSTYSTYFTYQKLPKVARLEGKIIVGLVAFSNYPALHNETTADLLLWSGWRNTDDARVPEK